MDISTFLRDWIRSNVPSIENRIYRGRSIQGTTRPYVVMYKISDPPRQLGSRQVRMQFSVFAESFGSARLAADEVREAIELLLNQEDQSVYASYVDNEQELYDQDSDLYHITVDGLFYFQDKPIWG